MSLESTCLSQLRTALDSDSTVWVLGLVISTAVASSMGHSGSEALCSVNMTSKSLRHGAGDLVA